jgi:hypothetical protein
MLDLFKISQVIEIRIQLWRSTDPTRVPDVVQFIVSICVRDEQRECKHCSEPSLHDRYLNFK